MIDSVGGAVDAAQECLARLLVGIARQLDAAMHLDEAVRADAFAEHGKRLPDRHAVAEAQLLLACRQRHRPAGGDDQRFVQVRVEGAPQREFNVAETATPRLALAGLLEVERNRNLVLASLLDAVLVLKDIADGLAATAGNPRGPDEFAFGVCLLREKRTREIQVSARPRRVVAQRP